MSAATTTTAAAPAIGGRADGRIVFDDVSKFYGEVLGVNRVRLAIEPGLTSLVGPNGSGKTTLMNLMAGLLRPTSGGISVLGISPDEPEGMQRLLGYATQYDSFPPGLTGRSFLTHFLRVRGFGRREARRMADEALDRVGLAQAATKKVAAYSKGMRQRVRLALATCHRPAVLLLDEPLNGLDPMSRAEMIAFFREQAEAGVHVIVSSHILHEVDLISDTVVLMSAGYVVAEGDIQGVREEMDRHPIQVLVRSPEPRRLAARLLMEDHLVEVEIHEDEGGLSLRTRDADGFFVRFNRIVVEEGIEIEAVAPGDADVAAVYRYLIDEPHGGRP